VSDTRTFSVSVDRLDRFQFAVTFDNEAWPSLRMDEPAPLGDDTGPSAGRVLGAAIGNCLAASLLFCLQKSRVPVKELRAAVEGEVVRNEDGRLRIGSVRVVLHPTLDGVPPERMARCLELFEDFCLVTQSVREGIDVQVSVETGAG